MFCIAVLLRRLSSMPASMLFATSPADVTPPNVTAPLNVPFIFSFKILPNTLLASCCKGFAAALPTAPKAKFVKPPAVAPGIYPLPASSISASSESFGLCFLRISYLLNTSPIPPCLIISSLVNIKDMAAGSPARLAPNVSGAAATNAAPVAAPAPIFNRNGTAPPIVADTPVGTAPAYPSCEYSCCFLFTNSTLCLGVISANSLASSSALLAESILFQNDSTGFNV